MGLASLFGFVEASHTQESQVTAIDILLEPDATMVQHARADNARLLNAYPTGFALDPTHHPHLTLIQQFVRTADLEKVYSAANQVLAKENGSSWNLKAIKYYYIPVPPNGIAGIVVEPTDELLRLQRRLLEAVAPIVEKTGTTAAFMSADGGHDIQDGLIDYVANFSTIAAGEKFNPHVTIGVAPEGYLNNMLAEPFQAFAFSPVGASVYQLGTYGAARKKLQALLLTP
jgi:2'-5' RNA ligase